MKWRSADLKSDFGINQALKDVSKDLRESCQWWWRWWIKPSLTLPRKTLHNYPASSSYPKKTHISLRTHHENSFLPSKAPGAEEKKDSKGKRSETLTEDNISTECSLGRTPTPSVRQGARRWFQRHLLLWGSNSLMFNVLRLCFGMLLVEYWRGSVKPRWALLLSGQGGIKSIGRSYRNQWQSA